MKKTIPREVDNYIKKCVCGGTLGPKKKHTVTLVLDDLPKRKRNPPTKPDNTLEGRKKYLRDCLIKLHKKKAREKKNGSN